MRQRVGKLIGLLPGGEEGTLHRRLYRRIRTLIEQGMLQAGERMPATRSLAEDLGLSRNTVLAAVEQLVAEGLLEARPRSGTFVADLRHRVEAAAAPAGGHVSAIIGTSGPVPVPFAPALPGPDLFPIGVWRKLQARVWRDLPRSALYQGEGVGWPPLRVAIAHHVGITRGLRCRPEQVIVTNTTSAALDWAIRTLARTGDEVWVEDPGPARSLGPWMRSGGLRPVPVPVDEDGLDVDAARAAAPGARLAFVTPTSQLPTCSILSPARRRSLVDWAATAGSWIVELDEIADFLLGAGPGKPPLAAAEPGRVVYVGSFNRFLFPALGVAFLVIPADLCDLAEAGRGFTGGRATVTDQMVLLDFLESAHYPAFIRRLRDAAQERREALSTAVAQQFGDALLLQERAPAFHLCAKAAAPLQAAELARAAAAAGVELHSLSDYAVTLRRPDELLFGFAAYRPHEIRGAMRKLAAQARVAGRD